MTILKDSNDVPITSMGADWISKRYPMGDNFMLNVHLLWDDVAPEGSLFLEYSGKEDADPANRDDWEVKNVVTVDGTFKSQMFIDANLCLGWFIVRYERTSGTAALEGYVKALKG